METLSIIISAVSLLCVIILLFKKQTTADNSESVKQLSAIVSQNQRDIGDMQAERFQNIEKRLDKMREDTNSALERMRIAYIQSLEKMQKENTAAIDKLRADNAEQLAEIRKTVDEKLQETLESRITKSFKLVSDRLEQVYKGLGEMQNLAQGVGDLKKVLTNVKSRGIMGEIQLGAILEQIMSPEQYDTNVITVPNTRNPVEYAIKLPDRDGNITYLPIDSKFPADTYSALLDAYDSGDKQTVDAAAKSLRLRILGEARDIRDKYVSPPYTTDFAILFLPFEGLYAEVVNRGLVEELQNTYHIMIAGPSTMAAMLNSIQMGFKTLAIEKRSTEVWEILGAVKTEFTKFGDVIAKTQERLNQANNELDKLVGVRTRAIIRKLRSVEKNETSENIFELPDFNE